MLILFFYYVGLSVTALLFSKSLARLLSKSRTIFFLASSLLLYLPYFFITKGIRDIELLESVGYFARNRIDVYYIDADHRLWPYLPLTSLLTGFLFAISKFLHFPFLNLWRLTTLAFLILTAHVIGKMLQNPKNKDGYLRAVLFLFSPIAIWPVVFHAHLDVNLLFFYLLAIFLIVKKKKTFLSGVSLGFSILAKTWSVIFLPIFFLQKLTRIQRLTIIVGISLSIVATSLFYLRFWHSTPTRIWDAVIGYAGSWTVYWGPQGLLINLLAGNQPLNQNLRSFYLLIIFAAVYLMIFKKQMDIISGSKLLMLTFFVFTLSWAPQYIFWVWPFIVVTESLKTIKIFSLLSLPYVFITYADLVWNLNLTFLSVLFSLPIWIFGLMLWYDNLQFKK